MTGRKSQLEKFERRQAKARAIDHTIAETKAKAAMHQKDIMEKGVDVMKETVNPNAGREDVFAVIARDSMETFVKTWNNSMETVIRETIRTEVTKMVQTEMESAMKGMFTGMNEAMAAMMMNTQANMMMPQQPEVNDEPVEFDMTEITPMDEILERRKQKEALANALTKVAYVKGRTAGADTDGDRQYSTPRYAKARVMTCGVCGGQGHNKRTCPSK